ncbi:MAG: hypothetical protein AAGC95_11870 [Pseudomonadota bacterium]
MTIERSKISSEAFFLYAETYLPDEKSRGETLEALQLCANGTSRFAPSVATYVFRPSRLASTLGEGVYPGSVSIESTELYLTHQGFRDHLETDEFRTGLRAMYKSTRRLGARLFWIGAKPPSDMMHNIFRSDPEARPVSAVQHELFDETVYKTAANEDVIIVSLLCPVAKGRGADAIDFVDAMKERLRSISFVAFFHPLAQDLLRVFFVAPIDRRQSAAKIAECVKPLSTVSDGAGPMLGLCQVHRSRGDLAAVIRETFEGLNVDWDIMYKDYSGYVSHPNVSTSYSPS